MATNLKLYNKSLFINCPFDTQYLPMFHAAIFAVTDCGFTPRCALEISDGAEVRIAKINRIIESCKFGLHDISRVEARPYPRFNMPLELGLFLGAKRLGAATQSKKCCAIFDNEKFRYQQFISDIAGQDIFSHDGSYKVLIPAIRDWLVTHNGGTLLPGGKAILSRYEKFRKIFPALCRQVELDPSEATFTDVVVMMKEAADRL